MKTEFLVQMDGVQSMMSSGDSNGNTNNNSTPDVLLIGATKLPCQLDVAVLRQFEKHTLLPLPDKEQRQDTISSKLNNSSKNGVNFNNVVNKTNYYDGSDINNLIKDASMGQIRDLEMKVVNIKTPNVRPVNKQHFLDSLDNIKTGATKRNKTHYYNGIDKKVV